MRSFRITPIDWSDCGAHVECPGGAPGRETRTQPLGGILEKIVQDFNASQTTYQVNAAFKGSYPKSFQIG